MAQVREEVVNVALSELLERRGLLTVPETVRKAIFSKSKKLPDITVAYLFGLRLVIEGRFESAASRVSLLKDAKLRVEEGISPVCLAVLYPKSLASTTSYSALKKALEKSPLKMRVISEAGDGAWEDADVDKIADALRHAYELIVTDDVVAKSVEQLEAAIDTATDLFMLTPALAHHFRVSLGIPQELDPINETE